LDRLGFLVQTATAYTFEHELVREGTYQHIAPTRRKALHWRAGEALEAIHPQRVEALAYHFGRAGLSDKALTYALAAGERAQAAYDYRSALDWYEQALPLAGNDAGRWDVLAQQEQALEVLGRREAQAEILDEMQRLAEVLEDSLRRARTGYRQGWREARVGRAGHALPLLEEAVRLARSIGEVDLLGHVLTALVHVWWTSWEVERCQTTAEEATAIFRATGNRQGESRVLTLLGNLHLSLTGNMVQALRYFQASLRIEKEIGRPYHETICLVNIGISYNILGVYRHSQEVLEDACRLMVRFGDRNGQGSTCLFQASNLWGLGKLAAAQAAAEEARHLLRQVSNYRLEIVALSLLARVALDCHDPIQAHSWLQEMAAVAQDYQQSTMNWNGWHAQIALVYLHLGQLDQAREHAVQAIATLDELKEKTPFIDVHFACYQVVAAAEGSQAAQAHLEAAFSQLTQKAERIDDPEMHRSFLENIPLHRDIVRAHETGRPPPIRKRVQLPSATAPIGRPLRDDEHVEVLWTIFAPDDGEVGDRIAARRRRLRRLVEEAAAQGASSTVAVLADALDVSARTVKRDLAALRDTGHTVHTRGERREK
jgi:tetratricopeptide (TPR) repeat protein